MSADLRVTGGAAATRCAQQGAGAASSPGKLMRLRRSGSRPVPHHRSGDRGRGARFSTLTDHKIGHLRLLGTVQPPGKSDKSRPFCWRVSGETEVILPRSSFIHCEQRSQVAGSCQDGRRLDPTLPEPSGNRLEHHVVLGPYRYWESRPSHPTIPPPGRSSGSVL